MKTNQKGVKLEQTYKLYMTNRRHKGAILNRMKNHGWRGKVLSVKELLFHLMTKLTLGCCIILLLHVKLALHCKYKKNRGWWKKTHTPPWTTGPFSFNNHVKFIFKLRQHRFWLSSPGLAPDNTNWGPSCFGSPSLMHNPWVFIFPLKCELSLWSVLWYYYTAVWRVITLMSCMSCNYWIWK